MRRRWLAVALAAIFLFTSLTGSAHLFYDPHYQRDNWRGAASYVVAHQQANDSVLVEWDYMLLPFQYYLPGDRIEEAFLAQGASGRSETTLRAVVEESDRVWVVVLHGGREDVIAWIERMEPDAVQLDYVDFGTLDLYLLAFPAE